MKKNVPEINMYKMMGYCPSSIFQKSLPFAQESLTFAKNKRIQDLQSGLTSFLWQELFGQSKKFKDGFVLHSGTEANEIALLLAKEKTHHQRRLVVTTNLSHSSIKNACKKLDLEMLVLTVRQDTFQVDEKELVTLLEERGQEILVVNMTYGTTQLGITEDVILHKEIQRLITEQQIRLHIDAAYGGYILNLSPTSKAGWKHVFRIADSIAVDPHKFAGTWGCGVLLLKNPHDKTLVGSEVHYYAGIGTALGTTRSAFPAATAYKLIQMLGTEGLRKLARDCHKKANYIIRSLERAGIELIVPIQSPNIPILIKTKTLAQKIEQELRKRRILVSPIEILSEKYQIYGLRVCITPRADASWKNVILFTKEFIRAYKNPT